MERLGGSKPLSGFLLIAFNLFVVFLDAMLLERIIFIPPCWVSRVLNPFLTQDNTLLFYSSLFLRITLSSTFSVSLIFGCWNCEGLSRSRVTDRSAFVSRYTRSSKVAPRTVYENPLLKYGKMDTSRKKRQSNLDAIPLCPTEAQFITPRAALNNQGNWMYVVNLQGQNQKYSQVVRSEKCT